MAYETAKPKYSPIKPYIMKICGHDVDIFLSTHCGHSAGPFSAENSLLKLVNGFLLTTSSK